MKVLSYLISFCFLSISIQAFSQIECTTVISGNACFQSIELNCSGGTPLYNYVWSNGTAVSTNEALLPGSHSVTVTDMNGNEFVETYILESDQNNPCDTLFIDAISTIVGDQIRVDFMATGFENLWTVIYSHQYDSNVLQYDGADNFNPLMQNLDINSFAPTGFNSINYLFMPFDPITLPDGAIMYSLYFTPLTSQPVELSVGGELVLIMNSDFNGLFLNSTPVSINTTSTNPTLYAQNNISVYPNPSNNLITFEKGELKGDLKLEIYDAYGKLLLTENFQNEQLSLSKEDMGKGLYFYNLMKEGTQIGAGKFIFY